MISACILHLLAMCGPLTIVWLVVSIYVDPVNTLTSWAWPHITKERRERFTPFIANGYSSATIVFIRLRCRNSAALNNGAPYSVLRCVATVVAMPVRSAGGSYRYPPDASAVCGISTFQMIATWLKKCSAFAPAPPHISNLFACSILACKSKNSNFSEDTPRYVNESASKWNGNKFDRLCSHVVKHSGSTQRHQGLA